MYQSLGHIIKGDLNIAENLNLRKLMDFGPSKYNVTHECHKIAATLLLFCCTHAYFFSPDEESC